jgi:hypothetical protein
MTNRRRFLRSLAGLPLLAGTTNTLFSALLSGDTHLRKSPLQDEALLDRSFQQTETSKHTQPTVSGAPLSASMWIYLWDIVDGDMTPSSAV